MQAYTVWWRIGSGGGSAGVHIQRRRGQPSTHIQPVHPVLIYVCPVHRHAWRQGGLVGGPAVVHIPFSQGHAVGRGGRRHHRHLRLESPRQRV